MNVEAAAIAVPDLRRPWRGRGLLSGRVLKGALGLLIVLLAWQMSVPLIGLPEYFYPSALAVWFAFLELIWKGILPVYVADSLWRYGTGVGLGTVIGVTLGMLISLNRAVARLLAPLINFLYAIVEVAWIPLFVIWWGYGIKAILVSLIYVVMFPVLYNTIVGIRTVPQVYVNAVRSLGGSRIQVIREVLLPAALPNIITGFRVGAGFAFRGLIFAEMIAAKTGLGYLIFEGTAHHQTARTVVGMICMGVLWLLVDNVYLKPFEQATVERWGTVVSAEERQ
jgi:NitT/TauT family transport system permease protein/taurine transport system permease protein